MASLTKLQDRISVESLECIQQSSNTKSTVKNNNTNNGN